MSGSWLIAAPSPRVRKLQTPGLGGEQERPASKQAWAVPSLAALGAGALGLGWHSKEACVVHPPTIASSGLTLPREPDQSQYKPATASGTLVMSANQPTTWRVWAGAPASESSERARKPPIWTAPERADTEAEAMM